VYGSISRFLPPTLYPLFEHVGPDGSRERDKPRDAAAGAGAIDVDVGARVRSLWA